MTNAKSNYWKPYDDDLEFMVNFYERETYEAARAAAITTFSTTGFNIFSSPRFVEHTILNMLGVKQTPHTHLVDGISSDGYRFEVKLACLNKSNRYTFTGLKATKGADIFLLVGCSHLDLDFFVLPAIDSYGNTKTVTPYRLAQRDCAIFTTEVPAGFVTGWLNHVIKEYEIQPGGNVA